MFYVDGSGWSRLFPSSPQYRDFTRWLEPRIGSAVTSRLSISEARQAADLEPGPERAKAHSLVEAVRSRVPQLDLTDEAITASSFAVKVLEPFQALHIGMAAADPDIDTVVTYDAALARVCQLYALTVVAPGMPAGWQNGDADPSV